MLKNHLMFQDQWHHMRYVLEFDLLQKGSYEIPVKIMLLFSYL